MLPTRVADHRWAMRGQELAGACSVGAAIRKAFVRGIPMAMDVIRIICAILLPPLGVFLQVGLGGHFWLNILLTLLGYIPGIVHAVWIIARR
jgi:uncharacterized membrane protein YqaE (UPF0057 family)